MTNFTERMNKHFESNFKKQNTNYNNYNNNYNSNTTIYYNAYAFNGTNSYNNNNYSLSLNEGYQTYHVNNLPSSFIRQHCE